MASVLRLHSNYVYQKPLNVERNSNSFQIGPHSCKFNFVSPSNYILAVNNSKSSIRCKFSNHNIFFRRTVGVSESHRRLAAVKYKYFRNVARIGQSKSKFHRGSFQNLLLKARRKKESSNNSVNSVNSTGCGLDDSQSVGGLSHNTIGGDILSNEREVDSDSLYTEEEVKLGVKDGHEEKNISSHDDSFAGKISNTKQLVENLGMKPYLLHHSDSNDKVENGDHSKEGDSGLVLPDCKEKETDETEVFLQTGRLRKAALKIVRVLNGSDLRNWAERESKNHASDHASVQGKKGLKEKVIQWLRADEEENDVSRDASWATKMESNFFKVSGKFSRYLFALTGTGVILAAGFQLADGSPKQQSVMWFSWMAGIVIGSMIGAGQVLESCSKKGPRNVVITGSTRGLGKALAREFLLAGDNVVVTSRSEEAVRSTVEEILAEKFMQEDLGKEVLGVFFQKMEDNSYTRILKMVPGDTLIHNSKSLRGRKLQKVIGISCNVRSSEDVKSLTNAAVAELGTVDIWINNAGSNAGAKPFVECTTEEIERVVSTNLMGSLICTREAILLMKKQERGGHVFNMDGAGSGGSATPKYAAYGATKCALRQFHASILEEGKKGRVGIHTASPGMVLTDLLLSGATLQNKQVFNIVCEQPETVARALVPKLRAVKGTAKAVNYLTPPRIILALVTAWLRRGRWFDKEGQAVYAAEADRLRMWAEGRERSPLTSAMELVPSGTWLSLFSSSAICAYIIICNGIGNGTPGT